MKKFHRVLVAGAVSLAVLVPAGAVLAGNGGPERGGNGAAGTCDGDQTRDMDQARDGTGWRHTLADGTTVEMPGAGNGNDRGPMDGSGPQHVRLHDGTGNQQRSGG